MFRELENRLSKVQNKIIETEKATEGRNNSNVVIHYLKILWVTVINTFIRTGITLNPSQDLKKDNQAETIIMINKEQNKQKKVLVILVRVKKAQLLVISLSDTAFKGNGSYLTFSHILCDQY